MIQQGYQPANGGYFGSMMTGNGGMGGNIGAQTAQPGFMDFLKQLTGTLSAMGGDQQDQGPSLLPPNSYSPFMENGGRPAAQQSGQKTGAQAGAQLPPFGSLDPAAIKAFLQRIGIGGNIAFPSLSGAS